MKSGGEITFSSSAVRERNNDGNLVLEEREIRAGLLENGTPIPPNQPIDPSTIVVWNGLRMTWGALRDYLTAGHQIGEGRRLDQATNLTPAEALGQSIPRNLQGGEQLAGEIEQLRRQLASLPNEPARAGERQNLQTQIDTKVQQLNQLMAQIRQANVARQQAADNGIPPRWFDLTGSSRSDAGGNGAGTGQFQARSMSMPGGGGQPGPAGGAPQAGGARGFGMPGSGGYGDPMFAGMEPPTSAAYAAALYQDTNIADGLGGLMASRREGQKLMMLFLYYARMAESGDPRAMYEFMKFLTYVISKDKARQNIHIGSKLIQLQDLSRKATETLMSTDTTDPNKVHEFTKALHQAKSQESTIGMSQKLLADMLQEFSGVSEGLISSTKNMQEFWMRASRRITSQA